MDLTTREVRDAGLIDCWDHGKNALGGRASPVNHHHCGSGPGELVAAGKHRLTGMWVTRIHFYPPIVVAMMTG